MYIDFIFYSFVVFLVGVGLGSLVFATRVQNAVKRGIAAAKAEEQKAVKWTAYELQNLAKIGEDIKKAL